MHRKKNTLINKKIFSLFLVLSLCWMLVIFLHSAKPADESQAESLKAGYLIGKIFVPGFRQWDPDTQYAFAKRIDHPVRKCAHATEYAILGILYLLTLSHWPRPQGRFFCLAAWLLASSYAATDEFHQTFVPGRSGQISDVILDSAGCLAGLLGIYLLQLLWAKIKNVLKTRKNSFCMK
ncbi:MAG: VanZ family protein [Dorea sp.]|nr:VanZ family protein [Dorea sp.]